MYENELQFAFLFKKRSSYKSGPISIYLRITLDGERAELATGTIQRYETTLKHNKDFIEEKYKVSDIDITKIDHHFITDLRSVRKCANNSAVKYVKNFKKIIRICLASGWLDKDPFLNYKAKIK